MLEFDVVSGVFEVPKLIFTVQGNALAEQVITAIKSDAEYEPKRARDQAYEIFPDADAIARYFAGGVSPSAAVAIVDQSGAGYFSLHTRLRADDQSQFPVWSHGAQWAVSVHPKSNPPVSQVRSCAHSVLASFNRKFNQRLSDGEFPWGKPRKSESAPAHVRLPETITDTVYRLNEGPDLRAAIAHHDFARDLPEHSRISWMRVPATPIRCDEDRLAAIVGALRDFEVASSALLREEPSVRADIAAGVAFCDDARLPGLYFAPPTQCFSVDRPDLHWTGTGLFASEVDEMPGGFPELVHLDRAYGLNEDRWMQCFDWLAEKGPMLFVVSSVWSKPYIVETRWLVEYLNALGYEAQLRTTDALDDVTVDATGVTCGDVRIGTIWRQFPIFETTGKLVDLVAAAQVGVVRLVPEFAHWGNKAWFSVFRRREAFFRSHLPTTTFDLLCEIMPDSHTVQDESSFPCVVAGIMIPTLHALHELSEDQRDRLVLKVCGANDLAARSYGVLMGTGLSRARWQEWIVERVRLRQPFVVQRRLDTGIATIAVFNTVHRSPEAFRSRLLIRPWAVNGKIVSVHGCAVPSNTLRVHGRSDMAVLPVQFVSASSAS